MSTSIVLKLLNDGWVPEDFGTTLYDSGMVHNYKDYYYQNTVVRITQESLSAIDDEDDDSDYSAMEYGDYLIVTDRVGNYYSDYDYTYSVYKVNTREEVETRTVLKWDIVKEAQ